MLHHLQIVVTTLGVGEIYVDLFKKIIHTLVFFLAKDSVWHQNVV
jgi:hypothetical protein